MNSTSKRTFDPSSHPIHVRWELIGTSVSEVRVADSDYCRVIRISRNMP